MEKTMSEIKAGTYALKLKKKHPRQQMKHGKHTIQPVPYLYDLDEAEAKLLGTKGPTAWIAIVDAKGIKRKAPVKKEMSPKERIIIELKEKGVKISGKETMDELEKMMIKAMNK